ncbi:MAG: hypothetical protein JST44_24040 [Cyanobacteria bacterium SZAS LIN-5]|nr:hypothetical protein [Cyanobacteria bacterium SZAS LIN-5]
MKKKDVKKLIDKEIRKSISKNLEKPMREVEVQTHAIDLVFPIHQPLSSSEFFDGTESTAHPFFDGRAGA